MVRAILLSAGLLMLGGPRLAWAQCGSNEFFPTDGQNGDRFGASISLHAGIALVGAPFDAVGGVELGSARVFERGAAWVETAQLLAGDGLDDDRFGSSVAVHMGIAVVGAPNHSHTATTTGAAYVFEQTGAGWTQVDELTLAGAQGPVLFGHSVAIFASTIVIGAPDANSAQGAVYVFESVANDWVQTSVLQASDMSRFLGTSVAIADGTIVAGGTGFDIPGGGAYVFERSAAGTWGPNETARLVPSAGTFEFRYGFSVATTSDVAMVGDPWDNPGSFGSGAVYVFERSAAGQWPAQETAKLTVDAGQHVLEFGHAVDLSGDRAVIGAFDTHGEAGAAHVFERGPSGWSLVGSLVPDVTDSAAGFGFATSIDGPTALVGAVNAFGAAEESGSAFAFTIPDFAAGYCFCAAPAPCFNEFGGAGCANSSGRGALLSACGSGSVASDDAVLTVVHVPAGHLGLIYMGAGQAQGAFGDGQRCVAPGGAGFFRFPIQDSGADGAFVLGPGIVAHSQSAFGAAGQIAGGQTWYFQAWFRDAQGPCASGFNFSNGLGVTFAP